MRAYPTRQTVRAIGMAAAAGVLAIGLAAGSQGRALAGPRLAASQTASFQSLGQMPGSTLGTDVSGISGDGAAIAGYGWICTTFNANGSCLSAGNVQAFRWTAATGMVDLGTLGGAESAAFATSQDGSVIVGASLTSQSTGSSVPFRWTAKTGMQNLAKLVNAPQRLILQSAIGVSADGTVLTGNGFNAKLGVDEPWRAVLPLP